VTPWSVKDCDLWIIQDSSIWDQCSLGLYRIKESKEWGIQTNEAQTHVIATQVIVGIGTSVAILGSILSMSSPNSLFSLFNQFQLMILLPMIPKYFPGKLTDFILGMDFALFSFDFIPYDWIPFLNVIKEWISYPQSDEYYNTLGMNSNSWIVNYLPSIAFILLLSLAHLIIGWIYYWVKNHSEANKWYKVMNVIFTYFTFNIYIRLFMETFMFVNLSIFAEMKLMNVRTTVEIVSLVVWLMFAIGSLIFFIISALLTLSTDLDKIWMFKEFFEGIKYTKFSKTTSTNFMLIRSLSVLLIVFMQDFIYLLKTGVFAFIHLIYTIFFITVRPFEKTKDNIIEILNQTTFFVLALPLIYLEKENDWKDSYEEIYLAILMTSPMISSIVIFIDCIKEIWK